LIYKIFQGGLILTDEYEHKKIPHGKWVQQAINEVNRTSVEAGKLIEKHGSVEKGYDALHKLLDRYVKDNVAYHIVVSKDCVAHIHQNKMREGWVFHDKVGTNAAIARKVIIQWYPSPSFGTPT
jgi:methyl-accepting chemotaxis protein